MRVNGETWPQYVRRVTGHLTQAQIAARAGISMSNVGRWLRGEGGRPGADGVIALAEAFGRPPIEALRAAGYKFDDTGIPVGRTPLADYTTDELFDELRRRAQD